MRVEMTLIFKIKLGLGSCSWRIGVVATRVELVMNLHTSLLWLLPTVEDQSDVTTEKQDFCYLGLL
jgi:hypothetical protein